MKKQFFLGFFIIVSALIIGKLLLNYAVYRWYKKPTVTIFIHGSRSPMGYLLGRETASKNGLHSVKSYDSASYFCHIADMLTQYSKDKYHKDHFYVFGWDGSISFAVRKKMAKKLYKKIVTLLKSYQSDYGEYPRIQIMTFSHGGNIALQLADYLPFVKGEEVELDLVLVACPVQATTEELITSPSFNHVAVISSRGDMIQQVDPHNLYGPKRDEKTRFFSRQFFDTDQLDDDCRKKVVQCAVTVNNQEIGHVDLSESFMKHVPEVLKRSSWCDASEVVEVDIYDPDFPFSSFYSCLFT